MNRLVKDSQSSDNEDFGYTKDYKKQLTRLSSRNRSCIISSNRSSEPNCESDSEGILTSRAIGRLSLHDGKRSFESDYGAPAATTAMPKKSLRRRRKPKCASTEVPMQIDDGCATLQRSGRRERRSLCKRKHWSHCAVTSKKNHFARVEMNVERTSFSDEESVDSFLSGKTAEAYLSHEDTAVDGDDEQSDWCQDMGLFPVSNFPISPYISSNNNSAGAALQSTNNDRQHISAFFHSLQTVGSSHCRSLQQQQQQHHRGHRLHQHHYHHHHIRHRHNQALLRSGAVKDDFMLNSTTCNKEPYCSRSIKTGNRRLMACHRHHAGEAPQQWIESVAAGSEQHGQKGGVGKRYSSKRLRCGSASLTSAAASALSVGLLGGSSDTGLDSLAANPPETVESTYLRDGQEWYLHTTDVGPLATERGVFGSLS